MKHHSQHIFAIT